MITKSIVKQTIEMLEDMVDYLSIADEPDATQRAGEAQSLLNFWRLYLNFLPIEDAQGEQEDDVCQQTYGVAQ